MNKAFLYFLWENFPSINTALNDYHLNLLNKGLNEVDDRVIAQDATKFDKIEASTLVKDVTLDEDTGILKITRYNGSEKTYSSLLGKISVNFDFNRETQKIILYKADGESEEIDLSEFITEFEFVDSDTIAFSTSPDGEVSAIVKEGSIQEKHLQPNYLADIKIQAALADTARERAEEAAEEAAGAQEDVAANAAAALEAKETATAAAETATTKASEANASAASALASKEAAATSAAEAKESEVNSKASEESAAESAEDAAVSKESAADSALLSESFAHGGKGIRDGEATDNSKYYSEQSGKYLEKVEAAGSGALDAIDNALNGTTPEFVVHPKNRHLYYKGGRFLFRVDKMGHLRWGVIV